mmetsp:Transcript_23109/g.30194  ORF Transcript_23109/g.30194 Transcript_23109/m.30194 type:complete len:227 (+) Transcript_23109:162-842(+)
MAHELRDTPQINQSSNQNIEDQSSNSKIVSFSEPLITSVNVSNHYQEEIKSLDLWYDDHDYTRFAQQNRARMMFIAQHGSQIKENLRLRRLSRLRKHLVVCSSTLSPATLSFSPCIQTPAHACGTSESCSSSAFSNSKCSHFSMLSPVISNSPLQPINYSQFHMLNSIYPVMMPPSQDLQTNFISVNQDADCKKRGCTDMPHPTKKMKMVDNQFFLQQQHQVCSQP